MDPEPNDVIVLSAISRGSNKFDKIKKKTCLDAEELKSLLERLEANAFIVLIEKKGFFGPKKRDNINRQGQKRVGRAKV